MSSAAFSRCRRQISIRDAHLFLADKPHMAGTARDRELAEWTRDRFRIAGLEDIAITTHDVLLPWPRKSASK